MEHFNDSEPDLLNRADAKSLEDLSRELQSQQEKLLDLKDARKEIEQIQFTRQTFAEHLGTIEAIDPDKWPVETLDDQLTKSLSQIDHARAVYTQARVRIDALSGKDIDGDAEDDRAGEESAGVEGVSFGELVKRGFALSLPLIITLLIFAFILAQKSA